MTVVNSTTALRASMEDRVGPAAGMHGRRGLRDYPRPTSGILLAMIVVNSTLAPSGSAAM